MGNKKKLNVIILGSTGAIGIKLAKKFYQDGENIFLFYRNKKKGKIQKKIFFDVRGRFFVRLITFNRCERRKNRFCPFSISTFFCTR